MVDIELLKRLAEACDIERCADEEERDRNLNEFYSVLEPEDVAALIAESERLAAFARGALGHGDDNSKLGSLLKYSAESAYQSGDLGRSISYQNLLENTNLHAERDRLKAENERLGHLACAMNSAMHAAGMPVDANPAELADVIHKLQVAAADESQAARYWEKRFDEDTTEAIDQLKAELERLQEQQKPAGDAGAAENCRCEEKLQAMQAELERARKDAERYAWLRERGDACQWMNIIRVDPEDYDSVDAAIDAAMGKGGAENSIQTAETRASAGLEGGAEKGGEA